VTTVAVLGIQLTGHASRAEIIRCLSEALIYLPFLLLFASLRPVRELFGSLAPLRKYGLLFILVCSLLAQLMRSLQATYPFMAWKMYTEAYAPPGVQLYEYELVLGDGSRRPVNLQHALGRTSALRTRVVIHRLQGGLRESGNRPPRRTAGHFEEAIRFLVRAWVAAGNPRDVRAVEVYTRTRLVHPANPPVYTENKLVAIVPVDPETP
jgi:hypothetical protein